MTDDICGWPTKQDGSACQHPATGEDGRCWIPTHGDADADAIGGRPSKFDDASDDILDAATRPINHKQIAHAGGVARSTLYRWLDERAEFSDTFRRARAQAAESLVRRALDPQDDIDRRFAQFILERSFHFIKTEKHEVDLDADHSFDATEGVTAEFVTYEPKPDDE